MVRSTALSGRPRVGTRPILGQRPENCVQNDQCASRDRRYGTVVSASLQEAALPDTSGRILRMEKGGRRKGPLFHRDEGRFALCFRRPAGRNMLRRSGCTRAQSSPVSPTSSSPRSTRMPVILGQEHHEAWLSNQAGKEVLVPYPADAMRAWPISPRVNSPKNNDLELIAPIGD